MSEKIIIKAGAEVPFHNNVDFCVGTGRMGLALTQEYQAQLKMVQEAIGFKFIRGHGLFSDDMAIYHEYEEDGQTKVEYNYTYLDRVFDSYIKLNIRPFLELGFMPEKLASGTQTIFYWKGNTTPPKDYKKWTDMVVALLQHLVGRYGEEVYTWPIEVWNEPNLPGFWFKADKDEYFKLFKETFTAIKAFDGRFRVGGPAICGVKDEEWIRDFCTFCRDQKLNPDFITRHHYTVEFPERIGHYDYSKLEDSDMRIANLKTTRDIIDSFEEFKDLPIQITEFSTSYTPRGVIHDTNLNAAYIAGQLARLGESNESYSYWTFGDVFEEQGVQFAPFHGGFGLVADNCIPKPTFWTFAFFKNLKDMGEHCVLKDKNAVVVKTANGFAGVLWNAGLETLTRDFDFEVENAAGAAVGEGACAGGAADLGDGAAVVASVSTADQFSLITKTVDEETCNPLKVWHDLGEPRNLSQDEVELLKGAAHPAVASQILEVKDGKLCAEFTVKKSGVIYFELKKRIQTSDRGYDYDKVITTR